MFQHTYPTSWSSMSMSKQALLGRSVHRLLDSPEGQPERMCHIY